MCRSRDKLSQNTKCADQGLTRGPKLYHAVHINHVKLEINIVPVAIVLCSLLATIGESNKCVPWHPLMKTPIVPGTQCIPYAVDSL